MLDPYILGLWIGGGQEGTPWIYLDPKQDDYTERVTRIASRVRERGFQAYFRKCRMFPKLVRLQLMARGGGVPLGEHLKRLGILHDPHIPEDFDKGEMMEGIKDAVGGERWRGHGSWQR